MWERGDSMKGFWDKWRKLIIISVIILVIAGAGYWGIKALTTGGKTKFVMVTKPVIRGELEVTVRGWGNLVASEEQDAISGAAGVLKEVFFEPGDYVSAGQVLAIVDAGSLEMEIKKLEFQVEQKRIELVREFGVSPDQVADVDPEAALVVRSPISGRITGLTARAGSNSSGTICRVVDNSTLKIQLLLPKPLFDKVEVGQKTTFMPDRFDGMDLGVVTVADPTPIAGEATYYYEVWVELENPGLLKVGDTGALVIHAPGGDVQQKAEITAYGLEETVSSSLSGRVKAVYVKEGAIVKAGDPILEFEAGEALFGAMEKQAEFRALLLDLEDKKSQLGNLEIVSPIDGVAMTKTVNKGQAIAKGNVLTRVSNYNELDLQLQIDEIDLPKIQEGQTAQMEVWGPEGRHIVEGVVSQVGVSGNRQDGLSSFGVTIRVVNPGFLRPYMHATAYIFVSKKDDVLLCPVEALYKEDDKWFADIKDGDSRKPVELEVGAMNDMYAEILSGLEEGQEVVVAMSKDPEEGGGGGMIPYGY
jgi:multidrug efflux pump subunit AcrA (membrane-fusion protein)